MKSTGLFGKNSGRVGGVVYSNYRGEQIVRSYQPKVNNPNTKKQVEQRTKFKLASQVAASLSREINLSYVSLERNLTARNAWMREILKKITYDRFAVLAIEDIVLTNSRVVAIQDINATSTRVSGTITGFSANARVRLVQIAYNAESEIVILATAETDVSVEDEDTMELSFAIAVPVSTNQYSSQRALLYVYEADENARQIYGDYYTLDNEAILDDYKRFYSSQLRYSQTINVVLPQNV